MRPVTIFTAVFMSILGVLVAIHQITSAEQPAAPDKPVCNCPVPSCKCPPDVEARLIALEAKQPVQVESQWKKGPMPKNTWMWGAITTTPESSGFYFADFKGDHVIIYGGSKDGKKVLAKDITYYNNSLTLPPSKQGKKMQVSVPAEEADADDYNYDFLKH